MKRLTILVLVTAVATALLASIATGGATATTIEVRGVTQNKAIQITMTGSGGSMLWKEVASGFTLDTCTASEVRFTTESPFTAASVGGNVALMSYTGCVDTADVIHAGKISVAWSAGTNGTASITGLEVLMHSTFWGFNVTCKSGENAKLGTLTGVAEGSARLHVSALLKCGIAGEVLWTGAYDVTDPGGLGVEN